MSYLNPIAFSPSQSTPTTFSTAHHASNAQPVNPNSLKEWGKIRANDFEHPSKGKSLKKVEISDSSQKKKIVITKNKKKKNEATSISNINGLLVVPQ